VSIKNPVAVEEFKREYKFVIDITTTSTISAGNFDTSFSCISIM
jgi:hypothetical protein